MTQRKSSSFSLATPKPCDGGSSFLVLDLILMFEAKDENAIVNVK